MTPTASRLKARLEERRLWFANEWFYKWHFIGNDGPVTIDSFDGREIRYGGIAFSGTTRDIYWDAVVRGVRKEINEQFIWIDTEVRKYKREVAVAAIEECAGLLASFVRSIRRQAVAKDRVLRGNGISFPAENDAGLWDGTSDREITAMAEALKSALPDETLPPPVPERNLPVSFSERALSLWEGQRWWTEPTGYLLGFVGFVLTVIAFL
jgi:hypothetical protein